MTDIRAVELGTITVLHAITEEGLEWMQKELNTDPWQWNGFALSVESQYGRGLVDLAREDGLTVTIN